MIKKVWRFFFPPKIDPENVQFDIDRSKFSVGSILLGLVLAGFLLFQTESALFEVNEFLDEPICPIICREIDLNFGNFDYYFREANPTDWVRLESRYQEVAILDIYPELRSSYSEVRRNYLLLESREGELRDLKSELRNLENQNEEERQNYETGLLEDIANSGEQIFDSGIRRDSITSTRSQIENLNNRILQKQNEESATESNFKSALAEFKIVHDSALEKYRSAQRIYGLKLMLIRLLLTLPLLLIGAWWYRRAQLKQSKYTILPLILLVIGSITFLQVVVMYASNWIPLTFFKKFFGWLMELAFGEVIVHYIIVFVGVVVVGGLIVSIQKKLFSGKRQSLRRLNKGECPFCAFPLKHSDEFCAGCGEQLKITCEKCGKPTLKMLSHCQHCGKNPHKISK